MKLPIYLDYHATTPCDPRVVEEMLPYFTERFGNPASRVHAYGWEADDATGRARQEVAALLGARAKEIIFTSGATESNNLAIKGAAHAAAEASGAHHIITCRTEHKAVLDPFIQLEKEGFETTYLGVDRAGHIDLGELDEVIRDDTALVSLMVANNETGLLHPMARIGEITRRKGVLFHTDAAQAAGKVPLDVGDMGVDLLSLSGHKMYGPKGVGALYVRRRAPRVRLESILHGGGHERGMRSGTLNVTGIVGLGAACRIAGSEMEEEAARIASYRDRLEEKIQAELEEVYRNGDPGNCLPNNLSLAFAYVDGESLLMAMEHLAVSPGSACSSGAHEPSYVLREIGLPVDLARSSIRFGLGRFTTAEEIDFAAARVVESVRQLRRFSPMCSSEKNDQSAGAD